MYCCTTSRYQSDGKQEDISCGLQYIYFKNFTPTYSALTYSTQLYNR